MRTVKMGLILPHEVLSAFYHFRNGDLFYAIMTGTPSEPCCNFGALLFQKLVGF